MMKNTYDKEVYYGRTAECVDGCTKKSVATCS